MGRGIRQRLETAMGMSEYRNAARSHATVNSTTMERELKKNARTGSPDMTVLSWFVNALHAEGITIDLQSVMHQAGKQPVNLAVPPAEVAIESVESKAPVRIDFIATSIHGNVLYCGELKQFGITESEFKYNERVNMNHKTYGVISRRALAIAQAVIGAQFYTEYYRCVPKAEPLVVMQFIDRVRVFAPTAEERKAATDTWQHASLAAKNVRR